MYETLEDRKKNSTLGCVQEFEYRRARNEFRAVVLENDKVLFNDTIYTKLSSTKMKEELDKKFKSATLIVVGSELEVRKTLMKFQ